LAGRFHASGLLGFAKDREWASWCPWVIHHDGDHQEIYQEDYQENLGDKGGLRPRPWTQNPSSPALPYSSLWVDGGYAVH
jgi:hypothetical protein